MTSEQVSTEEALTWEIQPAVDAIPRSFNDFMQRLLPSMVENVHDILLDKESEDYGALSCRIGEKRCLFRQAKTTPKKIGQFVTIWKRAHSHAEIAPFDCGDEVDFVIVAVHDAVAHDVSNQGFFVFDKKTLVKKRIFTEGDKEGKRAFRIYAPWVNPNSKQAINTQRWQSNYFVAFDSQCDEILKLMNLVE